MRNLNSLEIFCCSICDTWSLSDHCPMAAILYPHLFYFFSAVPSIHPKNHAPCDNSTSPQHRHPCQTTLAAQQHWFGHLDLNISSPYLNTPISTLPTFPSHSTHPVIHHTSLYHYSHSHYSKLHPPTLCSPTHDHFLSCSAHTSLSH